MKALAAAPSWGDATRRRLAALTALDAGALSALDAAVADAMLVKARREVMAEGARIAGPRLIVHGWAARVRLLPDGRRPFLSFLLPGDLIDRCRQPEPVAVSSMVALTELALCAAPDPAVFPALDRAYAMSRALEEAYLFEHIVRLGRFSAQERVLSLFVELHERLSLAGLASGGGFDVPLTQEMLADALGLTAVHVNRMVQQARRSGQLDWRQGRLTLRDPAALARSLGRAPTRVSAAA